MIKATGASYIIEGKEHFKKAISSPTIFIANHSSALDIPLLEMLFDSSPRLWISKKEYEAIPLLGRLVSKMHILVNKNNKKEAIQALFQTITHAKKYQTHIILFPEGTRSRNGKLLPFLAGFAHLAYKLNFPVIPIAIHHSYYVMKPDQLLIMNNQAPMHLRIGPSFTHETSESPTHFAQRIHAWFEKNSNP